MPYSPAGPHHRQSRRSLQKQAVLRRAAWAFSIVLCVGAFVSGFVFQRHKPNEQAAAQQPAPQVAQEQKEEALRLIDEAVRAKYEDRSDEALRIAQRARQIDPSVRGVDILAGVIAIESSDQEKRREAILAANRALENDEDTAATRLLLALGAWEEQGSEDALGFAARTRALRLLGEAADAFPSEKALHFFWSELLAPFGQFREVHRKMLSAMHRLHAWESCSLITRKASFASRDADAQEDLSAGSTSNGQGTAWQPELGEVGAFLTARQWELIRDELQESPQPGPVEN
jgi:tetratricopeptide (TPR) repeat protein